MGDIEKRDDEIRVREMREAVNFYSRKEYRQLGLTRVERERLNMFVGTSLNPDEIAVREKVGEKCVWKSLNIAVRKIINSEGYRERDAENFAYLRSVGL